MTDLKGFIGILRWHEGCNDKCIKSMPSEMTAMNSTLILLNALALAILVIFQFQPDQASVESGVNLADTYKPLKPLPQLAVMTQGKSGASRLTSDSAAQQQTVQSEHWVF